MVLLKAGALLLSTIPLLISCGSPAANVETTSRNTLPSQNTSPAKPTEIQASDQGRELFATNCMICHKESGKGGTVTISGRKLKPDDLTSEKIKAMTDERLIGYVTNGVVDEGMPAFKDKLSADEIRGVVAHVRTLQSQ